MIPYGKHFIDEQDIQVVADVLRNGLLTQGPAVAAFEQAVADYVGVKYAVAVSSGTAGLHLAALAAGVAPGATLITSPITFVASANAAVYAGGAVAFADIDPKTVNMSPDALAKTTSTHKNVRAIIPVHFAGLPCDMGAIKRIADSCGAVVIEDAAHALGATYEDGGRVGGCQHSLMTVFSFHPVKAIAAGEGGMITTNDERVYRHLLRLRSHGINKLDDPFMRVDQAQTNGNPNPWYYEMQELGFHYRITDLQCALALSQFRKLGQFMARRVELAKRYDAAFADFQHCRPAQTTGRDRSGHHIYTVRIDFDAISLSRAQLMTELRRRNIGTQVHYIPVPAQPFYRQLGHTPEPYIHAQAYYAEALTLPLFYTLTNDQQDLVIAALQELVG
jgi:perosamine synthetase